MDERLIVLRIEYDGTAYSGWQKQKNGLGIQQILEQAIEKITGAPIEITGAGRTDAGVHAKGQIAHFRCSRFSVPDQKIIQAINTRLPKDIRVNAYCTDASPDFHSTRDAFYREYSYTITRKPDCFHARFRTPVLYPFSVDNLFGSSAFFLGEFDFTSFSKNNPSTRHYICRVSKCEWHEIEKDNVYKLIIGADRFVYSMVRSIAGTMLDYARGACSAQDIEFRLRQPGRNNTKRRPVADARGLILENILYPEKCGLILHEH
jgi:tRNA pseudouridine38-40 synthase